MTSDQMTDHQQAGADAHQRHHCRLNEPEGRRAESGESSDVTLSDPVTSATTLRHNPHTVTTQESLRSALGAAQSVSIDRQGTREAWRSEPLWRTYKQCPQVSRTRAGGIR